MELGAGLERERAWSLELGAAGAGPTQDPGKHFFLVFILFVCLWSCVAQDTQHCSTTPQTTFTSSLRCGAWSGAIASLHVAELTAALLHAPEPLQRYSAAPRCRAAAAPLQAPELQHGSTLRNMSCYSTTAHCGAPCWLRSCCSTAPWRNSMLRPLHKESDGNCRRLLLLAALGPSSFGCFVSKNSFAFFLWLLWSFVVVQLHKEGNSKCTADFIFSLLLLMV